MHPDEQNEKKKPMPDLAHESQATTTSQYFPMLV